MMALLQRAYMTFDLPSSTIFRWKMSFVHFEGIFGMTIIFGKRCCHPTVGDTKYLQHLDIINVVIPATLEVVEARSGNVVILCFDGKDLVVKVHPHVYLQ